MSPEQKNAIKDFKSFGYVIVRAPRRSGKTTLLREIAKLFPEVYVMTLSYSMYKSLWDDTNTRYIQNRNEAPPGALIIGDEIYLEPSPRNPTACALTPQYVESYWHTKNNRFVAKTEIEHVKKEMSEEKFRSNFF